MGFGLIRRDGTRADQLAGCVVVLFGSHLQRVIGTGAAGEASPSR
jgi:hypothetical protein